MACLGVAVSSSFLASCGTALPIFNVEKNGRQLFISLKEFEAQKTHVMVLRNSILDNDILLVKHPDGIFEALDLMCTHEGFNLTPTKDKIYCNQHGSVFDLYGHVLKEPALKPLKKFPLKQTDTQIIINLNT